MLNDIYILEQCMRIIIISCEMNSKLKSSSQNALLTELVKPCMDNQNKYKQPRIGAHKSHILVNFCNLHVLLDLIKFSAIMIPNTACTVLTSSDDQLGSLISQWNKSIKAEHCSLFLCRNTMITLELKHIYIHSILADNMK